jgi:hypothetical protein
MIPRKILAAFFAAIFLATIGVSSMLENAKSRTVKSFLPDRNAWELKRIAITDDNNRNLIFSRINCVWVIGEENLPSDEIKVTALAEKLIGLKSDDLVTEKAEDYKKYRVSESQYSIKVVLNFKDDTTRTLLFGKATMGRPDYARRADETGVYLIYEVPQLTGINLDKNAWSTSVNEVSRVFNK